MARTIDRLATTLGKVLASRGLQGRLAEYRVLACWDKAVGPAIARHARPRTVQRRKLALVVDSPAWMQQLSLLKPEIVAKLNGVLGTAAIKDLSLTLGEVDLPASGEEEALSPPALDTEERTRIEHYVREIPDPETRAAVRRVIEKDLRSKKGVGRR